MPRGGAQFSSAELVRVLSHYDVGIVHRVEPLSAGNRRAPKVVVTADKGKFLLKRRPRGRDDASRVAFAHTVQKHLAAEAFPVPPLLTTADGRKTILSLDNHIYEFFRFAAGSRYDGSDPATIDAGRQLGHLHRVLESFAREIEPLVASFHDSATVRRHLRAVGTQRKRAPNRRLQQVTEDLMVLYNHAGVRVNELGFDSWGRQVVHGDWHPGNLLFVDGRVCAVLDFDSVRIAPAVTDLANALLQFSIVAGRPNPADWPDYCNQDKLIQLLSGYREVADLDEYQITSLVYMMIETMIAEAVLPIAATGFFGNLTGLDFLQMILRKATWLRKHRRKLTDAMLA